MNSMYPWFISNPDPCPKQTPQQPRYNRIATSPENTPAAIPPVVFPTAAALDILAESADPETVEEDDVDVVIVASGV
jgi:hypothetical protein